MLYFILILNLKLVLIDSFIISCFIQDTLIFYKWGGGERNWGRGIGTIKLRLLPFQGLRSHFINLFK